jgi:hypothetical protein
LEDCSIFGVGEKLEFNSYIWVSLIASWDDDFDGLSIECIRFSLIVCAGIGLTVNEGGNSDESVGDISEITGL